MSKVLGLDLGPNSIGWSLLEPDKEKIIATGIRVFQEGLNRQGGREESKNTTRRSARQARKRNARRRARTQKLIYILRENGMYPVDERKINEFNSKNPYNLRAKGLDQQLTLHEFGRVLYHINRRRGFKSNRKTDKPAETGTLYEGTDDKTGIDETNEAIKNGGYHTLGEYLNSLDPTEVRLRNRYTLRKMYIDEYNIIWKKQAEFYPKILIENLKHDIFDAIFFQRPLKSQKRTVRNCTFEPRKKASPKSSPVYQEFRILEQCSRLRITMDERNNDPLTEEEKTTLVDTLSQRQAMTFKQIGKKLNLKEGTHINIENQPKLKGHTTNFQIAKVFGKTRWYAMSKEEQYEIWHTLHFYNDPPDNPTWLEDHARDKWDLDDEAIDRLKKVHLESGYGRLSHKAMTQIIPHLIKTVTDNGEPMTYDKAVLAAGYHHSKIIDDAGKRKRLPFPEDLRNPIVQQALYEVRNVVNAIIDSYGKPDIVRVELSRDTKLPKWKRKGILALNRRRETERDELCERLIKEGLVAEPKREDIIKYQLWEECNKTCPYTGKKIPISSLFSREWQIEHIIPYSRSLDDSQANKTLCYWKENQIKHNKTPYEAYSHDEERYQQMLDRVAQFKPVDQIVKRDHANYAIIPRRNFKINKFKLEDVEKELTSEFAARQLVDASYISRKVREYLQTICEKVYVSPGRTTATLRRYWGLNTILHDDPWTKNREDHRHHAIDAMVIANTTPGYVKTMSRYHQYDRKPGRKKFPLPWESFRDDAVNAADNILISHKVNIRPRGPLHEETNYGRIQLPDGKKSFVVRKAISALTPKELVNIVDGHIKRLALERLESLDVDISSSFKIPAGTFDEPLVFPKSGIPIRKVRIAVPTKKMLKLYDDQELYVEYGKNHHVEIFEKPDGKREGRFVPLFDAVQRFKKGQSVVDKTHPEEDWKFIMSLAINELLLLDVESEMIDWINPPSSEALSGQLYRVQKMSVTGIITLRHHTATLSGESDPGVERRSPNTLIGIKVVINPMGKISVIDD